MSSPHYSIVEPHPSVSKTQMYIGTGRGGAGNAIKAPSGVTVGSEASGPASRAAFLTSSRRSYTSGRGGAGNYIQEAPRMFSFDEELQHQMSQQSRVAPVYHVGRGGAGNLHRSAEPKQTFLARRDSSNSASSTSSAESGADIATRNLKKGFKKLAGAF